MKIHASPLVYYTFDKWFGRAKEIVLDNEGVRARGGSRHELSFKAMAGPSTTSSGTLGNLVRVPSSVGAPITIRPAAGTSARSFSDALNLAWKKYQRHNLETASHKIEQLFLEITKIKAGEIYPAACVVDPLLKRARSLDNEIYKVLPKEIMEQHDISRKKAICDLATYPERFRETARETFTKRQISAWQSFFDNIESNPLTPEQRTAVVTDEDATRVLAGAGSGKTSVITAKTGYLVAAKIRKPDEILLMAFARDAAVEMSERIEQRCNIEAEARTFHALAYEIIGRVEGDKPPLADHATDEKALQLLLTKLLLDLPNYNLEAAKAVVDWFGGKTLEVKYEWDFETGHEYYQHLKQFELRTLQGEKVKSYEELMIANWLFENSIPYKYEADYEFRVGDGTRRRYCPDFYLPEVGVYIEHFGIRKDVDADGRPIFRTAPGIDTNEYVADMEWKRTIAKQMKRAMPLSGTGSNILLCWTQQF